MKKHKSLFSVVRLGVNSISLSSVAIAFNEAAATVLPKHSATVEGDILVVSWGSEDWFKLDKDGRLLTTGAWETIGEVNDKAEAYRLICDTVPKYGQWQYFSVPRKIRSND